MANTPPRPTPRRSFAADNPSPRQDRVPVPKPRPRTMLRESHEKVKEAKLLASKLPEKCSEDLLINYFERKKNFGRALDVEMVEYDATKNQAVVTFKSNDDLRTVLDKHDSYPCNISKTEIHIEEYREDMVTSSVSPRSEGRTTQSDKGCEMNSFLKGSDAVLDAQTTTIMVKGYTLDKSTDSLLYYLENRTRSGGGEVVSLIPDKEAGHILVNFAEERAVKSILEKASQKPHVVDGCHLSIKPFIISKTDLLFTNIPETVSEESLKNFLEARLGVEVSQGPVAYSTSKDRAVVKFNEDVDLQTAEQICKERSIEGAYIVPMPVSVTNTVLVINLPEEASEDTCRYYFENPRRSGGGTIEEMNFQMDEGYCLISFNKASVVGSVCQNESHTVMGTKLKVTPYHVSLGKPSAPETSQPWVLPEPIVTESQHEFKLKYIKNKHSDRRQVDRTLQDVYATVNWDVKPAVIDCSLSKQVKGYRKLGKTWTGDVNKALNSIMDNLTQHRFIVNVEAFPLVIKELNSIELPYPDEVAVLIEKNENTVVLVATKNAFKDSESKIQNKIDGVNRELAKRKERICKRNHLKEWKIRYLQMKKFVDDVQRENPNVDVKLDDTKCLFEVTGPQTEVTDVILASYEKLQNVRPKDVSIPEEAMTLLKTTETQQQIREKMRRKHFLDLWEINGDSVTVYTEEGEDFSKKKMIFKKFYTQMEFQIDTSSEILQRADKWSELKQTMQNEFEGCIVICKIDRNIKICARNDVKLQIQERFQEFMDTNSISHEEIRVEKYVLQFVQRYMDRELNNGLQNIQDHTEVKVEYKDADAVLIHGTTEGLSDARTLFQSLTKRVKVQKRPLKKPGIRQYMTSTKGQESVKSVETNTPCIIHMADSIKQQASVADQTQTLQMLGLTQACAEATLPTGQRVIVYGGNMIKLNVDVIVNAANEEMKLTGGLAAAILKSGGKSIHKECSDFVAKNGPIAIGNVMVSGAGNLACRHIVHAVGPRWSGGTKQEPKLLQSAIENCLLETDTRRCTSIAIPALCTGVYKYPVDQACSLIITTVHLYFKNQGASSIKDIYLCDINPKTVNSFMKALSSIVGITQMTAQTDQQDLPRSPSLPPPPDSIKATDSDKGQTVSSIVFGNTKVEVIKGNITSMKEDVIINSASADLNLSKGKASEALLKAGGQGIQDECNKNFPNGISVGEVAVTTAGSLKCKHILHIFLDSFNQKKSVESLECCVENCLKEAEKLGSQSIAFPALGTGNQSFPVNISAESMIKCAANYCLKNKDTTSIKLVKFVIFKDNKMYGIFVSTLSHYTNKGTPSLTPADTKQTDTSKIEKKVVKTSKDSAEFQIGDVHVFVVQGDITEQDTKVVVASSNPDLDLVNAGQVTKALLAKGGPEIAKDCEQKRAQMKSNGIAVIIGGQLKCDHIIFVTAPGNAKEWEQVVYDCLLKAEGQGGTSIAFPALGTVMGHDPGLIASQMYLAICRFVSDRQDPKVVNEVRIVIFQNTMLDAFINGIKASIRGQSILSQFGQMFSRKPKHGTKVKTTPNKDVKPATQQDDKIQEGPTIGGDECILTIYADDNRKIDKAFQSLEKMIQDDWYSQKIEDPVVLKLDQTQIDNIEAAAKKNNVQVKVDMDVGGIEVHGLIGNVMPVKDLIYEELRAFDRGVHEKKHAELLTNVVKWFWIVQSLSKPFEDVDNMKIENAYKNKDVKVTITDVARNEDFEIDFQHMQMHYIENPKEQYPVIRRDLIADTGVDLPSKWEPMGKDENLRMVKLADSSTEYKDVLAEFTKTLGRVPNIIEIHRIQNKTLFTQYAAKRRLMETINTGMKNEHVLWHGTDANTVASITAHGYNRSYCGKNAVVYGDGVYFAVNAQYSDRNGYARPEHGTGHKRMYRALVLVGHYAPGTGGMRVPPVRVQGNPDTLYDSVTNNMNNPDMFVIFHDTQAYPDHIITYT